VVLLTISLLLAAATDDTSSAGGDKLHQDDVSSGDNYRVPYDAECKISQCRVQVITLMGSKMTGSRIGRPLYIITFLCRSPSSSLIISDHNILPPDCQKPSLALSLSGYFSQFTRCLSSTKYPHGPMSTPPLRQILCLIGASCKIYFS
jgi:hypothetical protein